MSEFQSSGGAWALPVSIFLSALIIGGAIVYNTGANEVAENNPSEPSNERGGHLAAVVDSFRDVDVRGDHYFGNPKAPIKFIEWSDLECPFCKRFHPTVAQLVEEYDGQVAWVYRHFPLDQLHSKARKEAEATECAAALGGNDAFWVYVDRIFEITPANNGLDLDLLPEIAEEIGIDRGAFEKCLSSGQFKEKVEADYNDAIAAGGRGTPFSMIVGPNGNATPVSGALSINRLRAMIDEELKR
jgi:protein-disulfide isomerase